MDNGSWIIDNYKKVKTATELNIRKYYFFSWSIGYGEETSPSHPNGLLRKRPLFAFSLEIEGFISLFFGKN